MEDMQRKFPQRLGALMAEQEISQGELAHMLHRSRQSVHFYVSGKRLPDVALAGAMARVLGVSCDYLLGLSDFRSDYLRNTNVQ